MIWMIWMPFLVLIILVVAFWSPWQQGAGGGDPAIDIARRRLASGEISHEEFDRLKAQLEVGGRENTTSPALLLALLILLLLIAIGSSMVWAWGSDDWGWGMMGGMMGAGRNSSGDPSRQGGTAETITIQDFAYSPGNVQVPVGATVTWTNRDSAAHSATANDGSWDTGLLRKDETAMLIFASAATFDYSCSIHPNMKARLVVQ